MRLSAYVLAHRLGQVVDAANLRLSTMSDRRYSLVHTGQRGAGETRGGLSLLVRDDWTGDSRDPATLSGGETFVVSLALALGLADVITQEAGGADLDTLFVDEGFGSLDAETLEDVWTPSTRSVTEGGWSAWSATCPSCRRASPPSSGSTAAATAAALASSSRRGVPPQHSTASLS